MNIVKAIADITLTEDLLERALKLSGLVTTLFADVGFTLVVVGGSAVEFYIEGGYMSGDIDFCRREVSHIPLRLAQDVMAKLCATGGPRSWQVAKQMMASSLEDTPMDWVEVERLADMNDFKVLPELKRRKAFGGKRVPDFSVSSEQG